MNNSEEMLKRIFGDGGVKEDNSFKCYIPKEQHEELAKAIEVVIEKLQEVTRSTRKVMEHNIQVQATPDNYGIIQLMFYGDTLESAFENLVCIKDINLLDKDMMDELVKKSPYDSMEEFIMGNMISKMLGI